MLMNRADTAQYRDEVGELIAHYVVNVSGRLDTRAERSAKAVLIDSIAVAIAALRHPAAQNARKHAYRFPAGKRGCVVWGTQKRAAPELAALTNGVLLRCHDYNDFFVGLRNSGHTSDILSGVIAAAAWTNAPGRKLLAATAIGYERWLRNLAVGLGNASTSEAVVAALRARADYPSALVREHVAWALARHGMREGG